MGICIDNQRNDYCNNSITLFDVFPCQDNSYICLIGRYDILNYIEGVTCTFDSIFISKGILIDYPSGYKTTRRTALFLFSIPDEITSSKGTYVTIKSQDKILYNNIYMSFSSIKKNYYLSRISRLY